MNDDVWRRLEGMKENAEKFPVNARMDGEAVIVFRTKDGFRGAERFCPHLKASLVTATLMANETVIRCASHNFTFKLSNGKGVNSPSFNLRVFEVKVEANVFYGRWIN